MTKLNTGSRLKTAPMKTEPKPSGTTHEGAPGFARDARTELFMRATTNFAGEGTFYEKDADARAVELVRKLAVDDWEWVAGFLPWLRSEGNIRTSSVMLACEAAQARASAGIHGGDPLTTRQVISEVLMRGDEPTEAVQYCLKTFGKIPISVKRGVADAMIRLWGERAVIRYDKPDRPMRFADAIELCHPDPKADWQSALFKYLLDERHHEGSPELLPSIRSRRTLSGLTPKERHALAAAALDNRESDQAFMISRAAAGQWEWTNSWLGEGVKDVKDWSPLTERQRWELVIPEMGYMAVLRNLRNFDQAGLKGSLVHKIQQRLADPGEVANSRQLPFRFLSAYLNVPSVRWAEYLEQALQAAIPNVPVLDGCTLIMADVSGSMTDLMGSDRKRDGQAAERARKAGKAYSSPVYPDRMTAALVFAVALALKNPGKADLVAFATTNFRVDNIGYGSSLLKTVELIKSNARQAGGGTQIERNLRQVFDSRRHTRVVIFTDEQAMPGGPGYQPWMAQYIGDVSSAVPASVPLYSWNLAGYTYGCFPAGNNRYSLSGLTDASFGIMQQIENGKSGDWPWLKTHPAPVVSDDEE